MICIVFKPSSGTTSTSAFLAGFKNKSFSFALWVALVQQHWVGMIHQPDIYEWHGV
jgi:hypothetical protein